MRTCFPAAVAILTVLTYSFSARAQVPIRVIVATGETPVGAAGAVTTLGIPCIDEDGNIGFTGEAGAVNFVWHDDGIVWQSTYDAAAALDGADSNCGVGSGGRFIYSPTAGGNDAVWTHAGELLIEADATPPGFSPPAVATFNSRPHMTGDGVVYWVAGINTSGGTTTDVRVLYRSTDYILANATIMIASGDTVGGLVVDGASGVGLDYAVSNDGLHLVQELLLDTGSSSDDAHLAVDGALVAQESTTNGSGVDNWDNFDVVSVNNDGNYLFSGDTDGSTASDEFLAYNAAVQIREGDSLDGQTIGSSVRGAHINDINEAAFAWTTAAGEAVFATCDASSLASAFAVLATGDMVDVDGDGAADATVTDLVDSNANGSSLRLTNDGRIYLSVDLDGVETIIEVSYACCGNGLLQAGESCDDGNTTDDDGCSASCLSDETCGNGVMDASEFCDDANNNDGDGCSADCLSDESCGNNIRDPGEACDDGNTVSDDGCSASCGSLEYCGNGVMDAGEACDDGNNVNGDGCSAGCTSDGTCGNGEIDAAELCDDGNTTAGDGCDSHCISDETCGNGYTDVGEECDDGNNEDDDDCTNLCLVVRPVNGGGCSATPPAGALVVGVMLLLAAVVITRRVPSE